MTDEQQQVREGYDEWRALVPAPHAFEVWTAGAAWQAACYAGLVEAARGLVGESTHWGASHSEQFYRGRVVAALAELVKEGLAEVRAFVGANAKCKTCGGYFEATYDPVDGEGQGHDA